MTDLCCHCGSPLIPLEHCQRYKLESFCSRCRSTNPARCPTVEDIYRAAAAIRACWSDAERERRTPGQNPQAEVPCFHEVIERSTPAMI